MTQLFRRDWSVQVGTTLVRGDTLATKFEIAKSTDREPNTCVIQIANLDPSTASAIVQGSGLQIQVIAGYVDLTDTIFVGDVRDAWTHRDGADVWLTVEAEDGGTSYRTARVNRSWAYNVSVQDTIIAAAEAMGVGLGNTREATVGATNANEQETYIFGTVLYGVAWRQMDRLCRSAGLRWSVQNGDLQIRTAGRPATTRAIRLAPGTGLLDSPQRGKADERTGRVTVGAKAQLLPGLYPGRVVVIESSEVDGPYQVKRVRHVGESRGQDWYSELELQEYTS